MGREQVSKDFAAAFDAAAALLKLEAPTAAAEAVSLAALLQKQLPKLALAAVEHGALSERTRAFIDAAPIVLRDLAKAVAVEFEVEPSEFIVPPPHAHSTAASLLRALRVLRVAASADTAEVVADATKAADGIVALACALAQPEQVDIAVEFKRKPRVTRVTQARRGRGRGGLPSTFEKQLPPEGRRIGDEGTGTFDPGDMEGGVLGSPLGEPELRVDLIDGQFCLVVGDQVGPCFPTRAEAETEASKRRTTKGLPSEVAEAGIHVHALERENSVTKLDGAHTHLFAVEIGGETLLLLTEEDGAHQHTLTSKGDVESPGEHKHKVQLPDGTVIETGASISGHAHQSVTEHTAFDGVHAHTLMLGEQEFVSLLGKDLWTLAGSPPQASGRPAPAASELARLAPGVAMKALSTTAFAISNDQAEALIERSGISMLASPRRWDIGNGEVLLVCEGVALGVAKLSKAVSLDAQQFAAREREHGITAERLRDLAKQDPAWADTPLFGFEVEEVALFDDPCATTVAVDASGIVRGARLVGLDQPATVVWQADPPREGTLLALKVEDAARVVQDAMATGVVLFTAKQEMPRSSFALLDRHERMHGVVAARSVRKVDADTAFWAAELELRIAFDPPVQLGRAEVAGPFAGTVDFAKDITHPAVVDVRAFVANPGMSVNELTDADVRVLDRQLHVLFEDSDALAASGLTTEQIVEAHRRVLLELTARGVGTTETDALAEATSKRDVAKVIREQKNPDTGATEFCVLAETTGRNFGCFTTREEAEDRLRQIEAFGESEKVLALKRDVRLLKQDGTEPEERYVFGIVLVPNEPDAQGDIYDAAEVRRAAHSFMEFFGGRMKLMHKGEPVEGVKVIETYLTKTPETHGGETVPVGTWLMAVRVVDDEIWQMVKAGAFTGFSIGGTAIREALAA